MNGEVKKPVIFVFTTAYHPFIGGAEVAIEQVAKRLGDKFDFVIFTSRMDKNLPKREVRSEGLVVRVGFGTRFDKYLFLVFGIFRIFSDFGFRISDLRERKLLLWVMDFSFGAAAAGFLKIFYPQVPLVFTIQYGYGDERVARGRFGLMNLAFRLILAQADYVTAISNYLLELCKKYGFIGKGAVVHNGVDIEKFSAARLGDNKISNTIITVSRLVPKNGVDVLIKAVAELKRQLPTSNLQLHIVGDGPERKKLEALAERVTHPPTPSLPVRQAGLTLREGEKNRDPISVFGGGLITFHGSVPYNDLPKYLAEADVFVRPSRSEGMGNAFVEALAAGLPIIGTPVGGILDIIKDGETGLFAKVDDPKDLAEKIKLLLEDKKLAARIVENGRTMIAERFDWDKIAELYGGVFERELGVKKRILIATGIFPPEVGGPATYSKILLDELPKHGLRVRISTYGKSKTLTWFVRHALFGIKTFLMARNCDVLYSQDAVNSGMVCAISAFVWRKRFVVKVVGDYAWEQGVQRFGVKEVLDEFLNKKYGLRVELLRKIQKFTANRADKIIVPSEYLKGVVTAWGVGSEKIEVIYNACEQPRGSELFSGFGARSGHGSSEARERSNATLSEHAGRARKAKQLTASRLIVSAGRLVPWKGFSALIEIMPELLKSFPDLKLIIIGDGPEFENCKLKIKNLGMEKKISLLGKLSRDEVLKHLQTADLFVLNTAYEGFSHQILEAMALGIPVVTTDSGGNPELIRDGESGFLVKFNDKKALAEKISKLLSDSALAQKLSENAQKKAQEFSLERMTGETLNLFL